MTLLAINDNNTNQKSNYSKKIRNEIKEILEYFEELKQEEEDARLQEPEVVAIEP